MICFKKYKGEHVEVYLLTLLPLDFEPEGGVQLLLTQWELDAVPCWAGVPTECWET